MTHLNQVSKDKVVRLNSTLVDENGQLLEYRSDVMYLHGGYQGTLPKIEAMLEGLEVGMRCDVLLTPKDGFGAYDPFLVITAPTERFPAEISYVGACLQGELPDKYQIKFRVTQVNSEYITLDGNHPYAGKTVKLICDITQIRPATAQELRLGYAVNKAALRRMM